jgi:putative two-component system response regulator
MVLVVDDQPENLAMMAELLRGRFRTRIAATGEKALQIASSALPDLIVLDVVMPGIDGYEVCRRLKADPLTAGIPVIFLTASDDRQHESLGFQIGAVDFVGKPFHPEIFLARIGTHVALKCANDALRRYSEDLAGEVRRRTRDLALVQDITIHAMASLAETRDNETGNHIRRTQQYVRVLALALVQRDEPRFRDVLDSATIELLYKSSPLHDIGKVGVPDHILLKPGKHTPEEFERMKLHAVYGRDAIARAEATLGTETSFLRFAREIVYSHHEKWDGTGYPDGLSGERIPLSARLMAVADVYDALISRRVYKKAFSHEEAVEIIRKGRGSHFDPEITDVFIEQSEVFRRIASEYGDAEG